MLSFVRTIANGKSIDAHKSKAKEKDNGIDFTEPHDGETSFIRDVPLIHMSIEWGISTDNKPLSSRANMSKICPGINLGNFYESSIFRF